MSALKTFRAGGSLVLRRFLTACAALILASAGALYLIIGVKGMLEALTFSGRVIGAILFLAAIVIIGAALGLGVLLWLARRHGTASPKTMDNWGPIVIVGCASSGTLSFLLFVIQLAAVNFSLWLAVWAALALSSGCILYYANKAGLAAPKIKGLVGGLSVGLLISLIGIVYTDFYLPSSVTPLLSVSVTIDKASVDKVMGAATIPISITIRNQQSVGVYVLAAYYDVAGRVASGISPASQGAESKAAANHQSFAAFTSGHSYQLIQESPIDGGGGYFLNSNETYTLNDVATIRAPTSYDAIEVSYRILIMRDDRFELDAAYSSRLTGGSGGANASIPDWVLQQYQCPCGENSLYWYGKVSNDSYLLDLIRRPQAVYVWHMLPPLGSSIPYFPQIVGTISGDGGAGPTGPTSSEILSTQNLYGLIREGGGAITTALPSTLGIPTAG